MDIKHIKNQLKKNDWINDFEDEDILDLTFEKIIKIFSTNKIDSEIISLTLGHEIEKTGIKSSNIWLILLTNRELIFAEILLNNNKKIKSNPLIFKFADVKTLKESRNKKSFDDNLFLNFILKKRTWSFETLDLDSSIHFVDKFKKQILIYKELDETSTDSNFIKDFNKLETVIFSDDDYPDKKQKNYCTLDYFLNYSSILKSVPSLRFLFVIFLLFWIICDLVFIVIYNKSFESQVFSVLGLLMLILIILSLIIQIIILINSWERKTITSNSKKILFIIFISFILFIGTILIITTNNLSAFVFSCISWVMALGTIFYEILKLVEGIIEYKKTTNNLNDKN